MWLTLKLRTGINLHNRKRGRYAGGSNRRGMARKRNNR
jgi:hypothetical protein